MGAKPLFARRNPRAQGRSDSRFAIDEYGQSVLVGDGDTPRRRSVVAATSGGASAADSEMIFDIIRAMSPERAIEHMTHNPIFMRIFVETGQLDPRFMSSVTLTLTQPELALFIERFVSEMNICTRLGRSRSIPEWEGLLRDSLGIARVNIWVRVEDLDFIYSVSSKLVLFQGHSLVCAPLEEGEDLVLVDPADHKGFDVSTDITLFRGFTSVVLLPIRQGGKPVAVLECSGFRVSPAPVYDVEVCKLARRVIEDCELEPMGVQSFSGLFSVLSRSAQAAVRSIERFLERTVPAEVAEVFEWDEEARMLRRLSDGAQFDPIAGGIAATACSEKKAFNVPHARGMKLLTAEIDKRHTNRAVLVRTMPAFRRRYAIALRGRPGSPTFGNVEARLLDKLLPVCVDATRTAQELEAESAQTEAMAIKERVFTIMTSVLEAVVSGGTDPWMGVIDASLRLFGSELVFIAIFGKGLLRYHPTTVTCKFEDCVAGESYNYRRAVFKRTGEPGWNESLFEGLGLSGVEASMAFPFRWCGRVVGAVEVLNSERTSITADEQRIVCNMLALLLKDTLRAELPSLAKAA